MRRSLTMLLALLVLSLPVFAQQENQDNNKLTASTFSGLKLRNIGPAIMSGRIQDIAIDPSDSSTWYVGVGSGGVWKTTNAGTTWQPIFDDYASYSIGVIAIDPKFTKTIWLGTGEPVDGRHVGYGDGVYKSMDGGKSWQHVGLKDSNHIGRIVIDPRDTNVVYVAAKGPLWSKGGDRGVYKTIDGGKTWEQVLSISEWTGVNDLIIDHENPDILYAAAHQRHRTVAALVNGGPESGIFKTVDGGKNWRRIEKGLPGGDKGKIGLAISPQKTNVLYAIIELPEREGGFWRSDDNGESWTKMSSYVSGGTGPHYYNEIFCDPFRFDVIYGMDVMLHRSEDGGRNFTRVGEVNKHVDNHAIAFKPEDKDYILVGCDGGLYESWDRGKSWKWFTNLPITQFYKIAVDNDTPFYNVVGGTQDNNTQSGPSRTVNNHGIANGDWFIFIGGDGYMCAADPKDPNILYGEWQNGGLMRYDKRTGETVDIRPVPEPDEIAPRPNWDAPIIISPHDHKRLYHAHQRVWRSDDRGDSWRPISGDLSKGIDRYRVKHMDRIWSINATYDNFAMSDYSNITALDESPVVEGLLYAGTDDGLIQVTEDGGANWRVIEKIDGVPEFAFYNEIKASLHDADTVYAVCDNHKEGDYKPYLLKSTDRGNTWKNIGKTLPDRHILWSVEEDHIDPNLLFVGSEFGLFFTVNGGESWIELTGGVPTISFRDIVIQRRENDLVAGSFGRGFYILDDYSSLRNISEETFNSEAIIFPIRDAWWYVETPKLGLPSTITQGDSFYTGENPPHGATFTYYLNEDLKTLKQTRRTAEKKIEKAGGDTPYPGWDELKAEDREEKPHLIFTVKDAAGNVVRRLKSTGKTGIHRITWDMRYPRFEPTELVESQNVWSPGPGGPLAPPGEYTVELAKRSGSETTQLAGPVAFKLKSLANQSLPSQDQATVLDFQKKTGELYRAMLAAGQVVDEAIGRTEYLKKAVLDSPKADLELLDEVNRVRLALLDAREALTGDPTKPRRSEPEKPSLMNRISSIVGGHWWTTYGPTKTHVRNYEICSEQFVTVLAKIRAAVEVDLVSLEAKLESAGAPWTPGRALPSWQK
jgi:photosystem II stability/assembly factor-like uncharacterized protein